MDEVGKIMADTLISNGQQTVTAYTYDADGRLAPDEDEHLELRHVPTAEALALVESGDIADAKTILGVLWLDRINRAER